MDLNAVLGVCICPMEIHSPRFIGEPADWLIGSRRGPPSLGALRRTIVRAFPRSRTRLAIRLPSWAQSLSQRRILERIGIEKMAQRIPSCSGTPLAQSLSGSVWALKESKLARGASQPSALLPRYRALCVSILSHRPPRLPSGGKGYQPDRPNWNMRSVPKRRSGCIGGQRQRPSVPTRRLMPGTAWRVCGNASGSACMPVRASFRHS